MFWAATGIGYKSRLNSPRGKIDENIYRHNREESNAFNEDN